MADRIFTSTTGEMTLNRLRAATRLEFAALARLVLSLSLRHGGKDVPPSPDFAGKEIRRRSLLQTTYGRTFETEDEFVSNKSVAKDHVDNGLALMQRAFDDCGQDTTAFLRWVTAQGQLEVGVDSIRGIPRLEILVGRKSPKADPVILHLNDTKRHANFHVAMMGKPGVGKTQLLLKMLADIREQSGFRTNFILFDCKGDVAANERFREVTRASSF